MTTTHHAASHCPLCFKKLDTATSVKEGWTPESGDLSVCIGCGEVLRYAEGLALKVATDSELEALDMETKRLLARTQTAVRKVKRRYG